LRESHEMHKDTVWVKCSGTVRYGAVRVLTASIGNVIVAEGIRCY